MNPLRGWLKRFTSAPDTNEIIVVSGLPRSGTSLMMQLLEAGGIPILTDHQRQPDANNPRGYYEYEPTRRLARDSAWLNQAGGQAVKIVSPLLTHLPAGNTYRIIFMQRELDEIVRSQAHMRLRLGDEDAQVDSERLQTEYAAHIGQVRLWLSRQPNIHTVYVPYTTLLNTPAPVIADLNNFLGGVLNIDAMPAVIDPALYRERA